MAKEWILNMATNRWGLRKTEVALSLIYWSHISGDGNLRALADKVFEYGLRRRR